MSDRTHVRRVQSLYPQIWHACHRHPRAAAKGGGLTERQSTVLSHLDDGRLHRPADLARHLGIAPSTLSEAIDELVELGLVERQRHDDDRRRFDFAVTEAGKRAMEEGSALDPERLQQAFDRMSAEERDRAVEGLALLANACAASMRERGQ
jgi:DNA-binding MarR family transcriptional regulator